jgi:hypothetical protein
MAGLERVYLMRPLSTIPSKALKVKTPVILWICPRNYVRLLLRESFVSLHAQDTNPTQKESRQFDIFRNDKNYEAVDVDGWAVSSWQLWRRG